MTMKVLTGKEASFCYSRWDGAPRERVAGCHVLVHHLEPTPGLLAEAQEFSHAQCSRLSSQGKTLADGYLELSSTGLSRTIRERLREDLVQQGLQQPPIDRDDCNLAVCAQVSYHHDLPLAGVLGAWCLSGPTRDLVFPRTGIRAAFEPGTLVLFDSVQPHGLLTPGRTHYQCEASRTPAELTIFVSVLLSDQDETLNTLLGRERYCPIRHAALPTLLPSASVDPVNGLLPFDIQTHPLAHAA